MMVAFVETIDCRTKFLLKCFGEDFDKFCNHCDNYLHHVKLFNDTVAAQKVLFVVYRTGQHFGAGYIINVLHGKKVNKLKIFSIINYHYLVLVKDKS